MLLGYQPTESLVVSCLNADRAGLGLTLRFDLATLVSIDDAVDEIAGRARAANAGAVFLAVYTDEPDLCGVLPQTDLIDELLDHPMLVARDAVLVRDGRWWSYLCDDIGCCVPLDPTTDALTSLEASMVLAGSAVLADRDSLVAEIATDETAATPAQRRRVSMAMRRVAAMTPDARRAELAAVVERLATRLADPRGMVTDPEAALVAALCGDVEARDDLLVQAASPYVREELLAMLRAVVRRVPAPHDAPVCAVLAWFAYSTGDGTLVNIALDRALGSDPGYSLARLIETSLDRQLPPAVIEEVVRGALRDIAARDGAG
jgi:hypothetical protein